MIEDGIIIIDGNKFYEKDLTIEQINMYRKKLNETTLTDYDIELLYKLSKSNSSNISRDNFTHIPLKDIFNNLPQDEITINNLMINNNNNNTNNNYKYNFNINTCKSTSARNYIILIIMIIFFLLFFLLL